LDTSKAICDFVVAFHVYIIPKLARTRENTVLEKANSTNFYKFNGLCTDICRE